jgi:hypothetical protein
MPKQKRSSSWYHIRTNMAKFLGGNTEATSATVVDTVVCSPGMLNSVSSTEFGNASAVVDDVDMTTAVDDNDAAYDNVDAMEDAPWLLDSSDDDEPSSAKLADEDSGLHGKLAHWAVTHGITHAALGALLQILHVYMTFLPLDPRTLLHTWHPMDIVGKCKGTFIYFGVACGLMKSLLTYKPRVLNDTISLSIGVDGLPLFKSSNAQFWPILAKYNDLPPFLVALYYGMEKPHSVHEYLQEFVTEMKSIGENGIIYEAKRLSVRIATFICDAPARAFMKCVKVHNSYHACDRCVSKGSWNGRVVFDELDAPLRTDSQFADNAYTDHQVSVSPLKSICNELVTSFSLDYLHTVCLGVVRRIVHFWKDGPKQCRLGWKCLDLMSNNLLALRDNIPREFPRKPRSLKELDRFKATEFKLFLLYTGPAILKSVLSHEMYRHFMSLSVAMHILLSPTKCVLHCDYARQLLRYFVSNCATIYGKTMVVYNVHTLLHLADDVDNFKCSLQNLSAFPFENYMQTLKRYVRSARNPLAQVANRLHEFDVVALEKAVQEKRTSDVSTTDRHFYTATRDNCYVLRSGVYIFVKDVRRESGNVTLLCDVCPVEQTTSLFLEPCDSKWLKIACIKQGQKFNRCVIDPQQVAMKCMCLPREGHGCVVIPMIDDGHR